jgi:hypothetical protein
MRSPVSLLTLPQTGHRLVSATQILSRFLTDLNHRLCPEGQLPPVRGEFSNSGSSTASLSS